MTGVQTCALPISLLVLGLSNPWVSATVMITALVVSTATTRNLSLIATTLALSLPTGLSMLLIYVPFAATYRDGLVTAGQLSLRFAALITALLATLTAVRIPELVKALQTAAQRAIVELAHGEPFLFQLAGERAWYAGTDDLITAEHVRTGWRDAAPEAEAHVQRILDRLPPRERHFLEAMAALPPRGAHPDEHRPLHEL